MEIYRRREGQGRSSIAPHLTPAPCIFFFFFKWGYTDKDPFLMLRLKPKLELVKVTGQMTFTSPHTTYE